VSRRVNVRLVILMVSIAIIAIEGYLVYRYYERLADTRDTSTASTVSEATSEQTRIEQKNAKQKNDTAKSDIVFIHHSAPRNVIDNSTYIDNPLINGNPEAVLLVTQVWEPGGDGVNNAHEIGVWYDANRDGKWAIYNQDLAAMPDGAVFNVVVLKRSEKLVHHADSGNIVAYSTYIDNRLINGSPNVVLSITQDWNPGGGAGTYNDHPIGARYDAQRGKWAVFNRDLSDIPKGAAFNVAVSEPPAEAR